LKINVSEKAMGTAVATMSDSRQHKIIARSKTTMMIATTSPSTSSSTLRSAVRP